MSKLTTLKVISNCMAIAFEFVQIVLLRKRATSAENSKDLEQGDGDDVMLRGIDGDAIKKEFGDAKFFEGSILPPQDQFCNFYHPLILLSFDR